MNEKMRCWRYFFLLATTVGADVAGDVWRGFVERNSYQEPFLIHRPRSEAPGDAVSEGVGYGLLLALWAGDQPGFDRLLDGAEQTMWNGYCYDWRVDAHNQKLATGCATDAEQDIAFALIAASRRVSRGEWRAVKDYGARATLILGALWEQGIAGGLVLPGYHWGGEYLVNPGYFAPAWYRVFAEHDPGHDWLAVVDRSYAVLEKSPGYDRGLVPDWMTAWGEPATGLGYNAYGNGWYMYKDAIRVFWRVGTDLLWNDEPRARAFLENAYRFIRARRPDFFGMDGSLLPADDVWVFDGGSMSRHRREHGPLTIGMWLVPVWLLGTEQEKTAALDDLLSFRRPNETFWANDGEPDELYFEQFLGTFGWMFTAQT